MGTPGRKEDEALVESLLLLSKMKTRARNAIPRQKSPTGGKAPKRAPGPRGSVADPFPGVPLGGKKGRGTQ